MPKKKKRKAKGLNLPKTLSERVSKGALPELGKKVGISKGEMDVQRIKGRAAAPKVGISEAEIMKQKGKALKKAAKRRGPKSKLQAAAKAKKGPNYDKLSPRLTKKKGY
jgi:hypothetical protein